MSLGNGGQGKGGQKKFLMQKLINESAHNLLEMRKKKIPHPYYYYQ
jgi:hypothetical protein